MDHSTEVTEEPFDDNRFAVTKDLLHLVQYNSVAERWISEVGASYTTPELEEIFPKECSTPPAALGRAQTLRIEREAKNRDLQPADDAERVSLLRNAIAKVERDQFILVPSKFAGYLLSEAAPFEVVTLKDTKQLLTYDRVTDNGLWNLKGELEIERFATEPVSFCGPQVKEQLTRFVMAEVLAWIRWKTYVDREAFRSPLGKIPLLNGVYDYATDKFERHRQENHFLYQLPVKYDEAAACPKIDKFLEEVLGARKTLAYEIGGYALAESTPNKWQRAFMLVGPGDNGKSTFLNLLTSLFGQENVANQTLQSLVENRFSTVTLDHKLANIASDIGDRSLFNTWQFKNLTGGDRIMAEHKFRDPYEFQNRAILMFSCNSLPESYDDSDAFHKRWVIAQFENVFAGDQKDPKLLEKLTTPTELSGFLNQAIQAYREMDKRGRFTGEGTTAEKREYYTKLSDPVSQFVEDQVLFDPNGSVIKQHLFEEFRLFCQKRGYGKTFTQKRFFKKFREKAGDQIRESWVEHEDGMHRVFRGINLEAAILDRQTKLGET